MTGRRPPCPTAGHQAARSAWVKAPALGTSGLGSCVGALWGLHGPGLAFWPAPGPACTPGPFPPWSQGRTPRGLLPLSPQPQGICASPGAEEGSDGCSETPCRAHLRQGHPGTSASSPVSMLTPARLGPAGQPQHRAPPRSLSQAFPATSGRDAPRHTLPLRVQLGSDPTSAGQSAPSQPAPTTLASRSRS